MNQASNRCQEAFRAESPINFSLNRTCFSLNDVSFRLNQTWFSLNVLNFRMLVTWFDPEEIKTAAVQACASFFVALVSSSMR